MSGAIVATMAAQKITGGGGGSGNTRTSVHTANFTGVDDDFPTGFDDLCNGNGIILIKTNQIHAFFAGNPSDMRSQSTFTNAQYAKLTISGLTSGTETSHMGIGLRYSSDVNPGRDGYRIYVLDDNTANGALVVSKVTNDTAVVLRTDTSQAWANGDTIEAEIADPAGVTTMWLFRNGSLVGTPLTDASSPYTTGKPAVYCLQGATDSFRGDNFEAGNIT